MRFRLGLVTLLIGLISATVPAQSWESEPEYTVQVASFPDYDIAERYAATLARSIGLKPVLVTIDLNGRGHWTRVQVGEFSSPQAARNYGANLKRAGMVMDYLVVPRAQQAHPFPNLSNVKPVVWKETLVDIGPYGAGSAPAPRIVSPPLIATRRGLLIRMAECDVSRVPSPDATLTAINLLLGKRAQPRNNRPGGLWISGDRQDALSRLRWIAGSGGETLIRADREGRVSLNWAALKIRAGIFDDARADAGLVLANYIAADEGLTLLVQLTQSHRRVCLHIGRQAPTQGKPIEVGGGVNLDVNFDSRINPYRKENRKLDIELPPEGFDALVAMNPDAVWLNLATNSVVPAGHITFHELAEAHAKLELGLDYLPHGSQPGAHDVALQREVRLKLERPTWGVVVTTGANRVFKNEELVHMQPGYSHALKQR